MPDVTRNDVSIEATALLSEAKSKPMSTVLKDYIQYLTDHPEVNRSSELSTEMSTDLRQLLPNLIVEDVKESSPTDTVRLLANESISDLSAMAQEANPRSELAKEILGNLAFFRSAGAVSADGKSLNLGEFKVVSDNGNPVLTGDKNNISEEFLADGTILWRDGSSKVIGAQYDNGMIVQVTGSDSKSILSQQDLASSSYVPVRIMYPNGSIVDKDPDKGTFFFSDAKTGLTYPTAELKWQSSYFNSLGDKYVIPMANTVVNTDNAGPETLSTQATFNKAGDLVILNKTFWQSDGKTLDKDNSEAIDSVNGYLKLKGEPAYMFNHSTNSWQMESPMDSGNFVDVANGPTIRSAGGHLDVVLPADTNRGAGDMFPGGTHIGYYPNGFSYDADYQRTFAGGVQIFNLRGGTSNLNQPSQILLQENAVVVLPDYSTIQSDHGQWFHYAYAGDPQNPLARGAVLGSVSQPIIDYSKDVSSDPTTQQMYFQTDNRDAPLVPFSDDAQSRTYNLQVNGALETFSYGGALNRVTRRDGSVIQFSSKQPVQPVKITFDRNTANPNGVNLDEVDYDPASQQWVRDGKPVQVDGLGANSDYSQLVITDVATGSKDTFPGGGLPPTHTDAPQAVTPVPTNDQNGEIKLSIFGSSYIDQVNGVPSSVVLDDTDIQNMGYKPLLNNTKFTIPQGTVIPADWNNESTPIQFHPVENPQYTVTISGNPKQVTVIFPNQDKEIFTSRGVQYYPNS